MTTVYFIHETTTIYFIPVWLIAVGLVVLILLIIGGLAYFVLTRTADD